jgi:hypothetical protein
MKQYKYEECERVFRYFLTHRRYVKIHTREKKPFKFSECNKDFRKNANFTVYVRTHTRKNHMSVIIVENIP